MTGEEAIKAIKTHCYFANLVPVGKEALDMAIKALEQEPCEDVISRKWVLDVVNNFVFDTETDRNRIIHIVRDTAPLVIPKEKQEPVLDKIRAEIMDFEEELFHRPHTDYTDYAAVRHCVKIIDKCKAESENKE